MSRKRVAAVFARLAIGAGALLALALVSSIPFTSGSSDRGVVRLSWRALGREVEYCRPLSPEEIARQPAHMRRTEACSGRIDPYRLRFSIDGTLALDTVLQAAGARGDRPIYVLRDVPVVPGKHRLEVQFTEVESRGHRRAEPATRFPEALSFRATARIRRGAVLLITYDADQRMLVSRSDQ